MRALFLMFIVVPVIEMFLLIKVGGIIGALPTIGLVLLTAVIGSWLLRKEGISTLARANHKMQSGQLPAKEMAEGIAIAVGGALLLTPGFVTDFIGFSCLIPGIRRPIMAMMMKRMVAAGGTVYMQGQSQSFNHQTGPFDANASPLDRDDHDHDVIEGDFRREK
ncbi:hypothetical protein SIN8267_02519 [Sinobacterium norvegicum]|uniref:Exlusion protein FxsA n=1 Tax=Sinobacterium norvegicum TaxID=1641715 RepID=A0ABN8EJ24_9GAMM|nr:FxsA family protein [Sinobacterium norvegicum]CAH0992399.1 hypothetical protein SIN8267_02519 [Sinobacterium norvegicum]